ncbi:MAG: CinA family nicotinamide mononucleotide deamidase-related protein [Planctomycetes bacterium]|jgi:nicotinamide-nucleotide amidase|nr:CinA family nicotinamide mononucleotide deamidase-related protein [Planctomycetota bacterium]MCL4729797.1 CinA family nicotinamide mononucleotide deamidase-related protein [Planctomycetota bacterium]
MALSRKTARVVVLPPVAIFAVGSEVVQGFIINSNAAWLAREMAELGFDVVRHEAVRDDKDAIAARLRPCMPQGLLVIVCGGIGPTTDDLTRQAVAEALGRKLVLDKDDLARLQARYTAMGREFPRGSEIQCMRPDGARLIPNAYGTASCFLVRHGNGGVAVLPGVPREMKAVFADELRKALAEEFGSPGRFFTRELKCFGLPESAIDNLCKDLLQPQGATAAILVDDAVIRLRWRVMAADETAAAAVLAPLADEARRRLGEVVFGTFEDSLEGVTLAACKQAGLKVALAESCTGGMIAHLLTNVPGSSEVLVESCVTYDNQAKIRRLGVKPETLQTHGTVSEACVREMVEGIARESKTDLCVATSGIAGPGGGSEDKPVGTVWLGAWFRGETRAWRLQVPGDRELVKWRSARTAINLLRMTAQKGALPDRPAHWIAPPSG